MEKVFIFDLDGTLLNSKSGILFSLGVALKKNSPEYLPFLNESIIGPPINGMLDGFIKDPSLISKLSQQFRVHYDSIGFLETKLYHGVKDGLCQLQNSLLYVSTNKPEKVTKKILAKLEIDCFFTDIVCIDSASYRDKTEIVNTITKKYNNHKITVVGDSVDDYNSAVDNNCNFVYCSYGYGDLFFENQNIKSVNSVKELFSAILE